MTVIASDKKPHHLRILSDAEIDDLYAQPKLTEDEMAFLFELNAREAAILTSGFSMERKIDAIIQLGFFRKRNDFLSSPCLMFQQKPAISQHFILVKTSFSALMLAGTCIT